MMKFNSLVLSMITLCTACGCQAVFGETVAYWRFEDGVAGTDVNHIAVDGNTFSADILDVSGNGNHLSTWVTGGCCGYQYRSDVGLTTISDTGAANTLSVKNTGGAPGMFTNSAVSLPTGVDIDTMMPTAFTVEASWKFENGGHRTVVGRDAQNVSTGNAALAALYLQARPDNSIGILFVDAAGNTHEAFSPADYVQGYTFGSDPDGLTAEWYHLVGVSDGSTLSMYVNNELVASTPITSADPRLAVGTTSGGDWHAGGWSVGRGLFGGGHTDRGYGFIDEVRISNHALEPSEFLNRAALMLEVDATSGAVTLKNTLSTPVNIDSLQIFSAGNALSLAGWNSLDDQNFDAVDGADAGTVAGDSVGEGWDQAGGSHAGQLIEHFLPSEGSTIAGNQTISLGNAFDTTVFGQGVQGDLEFLFEYNGGALTKGLVSYLTSTLPGDFDNDGDVDGRDFLTWQRNPGVGNLSDWQNNYGSGSLTAAIGSVPEPASAVLLGLLGLTLTTVRRK